MTALNFCINFETIHITLYIRHGLFLSITLVSLLMVGKLSLMSGATATTSLCASSLLSPNRSALLRSKVYWEREKVIFLA